ncbi:phosphoheptose isomerase [Pedobacter hiemivivus]|jgi:mannose-6-phosphate isomerase|uniref:Phosphoheptose isomerase n=1 Tax=Pedobacter hiemivivus TaxID=2530454 RepID=A0A4U1GPF3_9SPHI|nr:phosphoheptose isomerase [Pedobacter hiemivivus]TKC63632.1 phosphoheptose isomerase [Pedobacter hiemivivus]
MLDQKKELFDSVAERLKTEGFNIVNRDETRPWGGFFVIDEDQAQQFANVYFDSLNVDDLKISGKLSPKILIVAPKTRLSWQYHHRRAEIWKVVNGPVGVMTNETDDEGHVQQLVSKETIRLKQGERHRLIGLGDWGIVSEIWQHTDPENPSDESDIVRVQDDFGR